MEGSPPLGGQTATPRAAAGADGHSLHDEERKQENGPHNWKPVRVLLLEQGQHLVVLVLLALKLLALGKEPEAALGTEKDAEPREGQEVQGRLEAVSGEHLLLRLVLHLRVPLREELGVLGGYTSAAPWRPGPGR